MVPPWDSPATRPGAPGGVSGTGISSSPSLLSLLWTMGRVITLSALSAAYSEAELDKVKP
jgi:hypothetical protein